MQSKKAMFFNKLSFLSLIATIFLSIFFFIPFIPVTLGASKGFLISVGVTLAILFWLIARLFDGKFIIPKDKLILFALFIPVIFLIASFFSSSSYISLFGAGFEVGTFGTILVLFFVLFLSSIYFQTEKRLWYFFITLLGSAFLLGIFQLLYSVFNLGNLMPRFFAGITTGNLLGSWNDFALFYGLIIIISLFTLEFLKTKPAVKYLLYVLVALGVFFLIIINIPLIWLLVGIFSLVVFVYNISLQHTKSKVNKNDEVIKESRFSLAPLIIVLVSLLFLISNNFLGPFISRYVSVPSVDVRPSIQVTSQIAWKAIKHNPFLGTGPNTFSIDWAQWKPQQITKTIFWNTDFTNGVGLIPTFAVTTGIVGLLAWIVFLGMFFTRGFKSMKLAFQKVRSNYFIIISLIVSLYCWIIAIVYVPNIVMFMLAFAATGVSISVLASKNMLTMYDSSFLTDPRSSFFSIFAIVILIIGSISVTYIYTEKFVSIVYFSKSLNPEANIESLVNSERMLINAITLDKSDMYYRALSQVYIAQIHVLLNDKTLSKDTIKSSVQTLVSSAEQNAGLAVNQNNKNYTNWVNLGDIYSAFLPLGVSNSYENAIQSYDKAIKLAPKNPSIFLSKARLELAKEKEKEAKDLISQALKMKENYVDAIFMFAQIELNKGNIKEAIKQVEYASFVSPNDPNVFFQLGVLRYNNKDYSGAVGAFETSVILDQSNLNAHYLLAFSYQKAGKTKRSIVQFRILNQAFPENENIKANLDSLSAGKGLISTELGTEVSSEQDIVDTTKTQTDSKTKLSIPEKQ